MLKTLYFDTETTGLNPRKHSIIQFAAIVEYDGEEVDSIDVRMQPFEEAIIDEYAMEKIGITPEDLFGYMEHHEGFLEVQRFLDKHCNKFDKSDKMYPCGYNARFDMEFLNEFFKYNGEKYGVGSYFYWKMIDPLPLLHIMDWKGKISLENYKLETVCNHFKIPLDKVHDGAADIKATRQLIKKLL